VEISSDSFYLITACETGYRIEMKLEHSSKIVDCPNLSAITWDKDNLIEVPSGRIIQMDGTVSPSSSVASFAFDRALSLRSGDVLWTLAYANRGTKAVLFKNSCEHRELNRSYYFADTYDYPIALTTGPAGQAVIIHCPNAFNIVECEEAESGEILWSKKTEAMEFHSRLSISPNGRFFLSAGWFWHPLGGAWLCSLSDDSGEPRDVQFSFGAEIDSATFLDDDHVVVSSTDIIINSECPKSGLGPMQLGVWSISKANWVSRVPISATTGTIMPWRDWVISFYEHPKLIELKTGKVVHTWEHLNSGRQIGAIDIGTPQPPPMALNPNNGMFALCDDKRIHIVSLFKS
jgi:hypothetical protein